MYEVGQGLQRLGERPRRAVAKVVADGRRRAGGQAVASEDGESVGEGGRVGGRRARGDHVEGIADHVGNDKAVNRTTALRERLGQSASLDARQVLADAVHFIDRRPAGVQQGGDALFILQRHALYRRRQQAEPPPDNRHRPRSFGPDDFTRSSIS